MIFAHTYQWIIDKSPHTGEQKNQTRRTANSLTPRYRVGKTYAIQPGRGKPAVGRIRILSGTWQIGITGFRPGRADISNDKAVRPRIAEV